MSEPFGRDAHYRWRLDREQQERAHFRERLQDQIGKEAFDALPDREEVLFAQPQASTSAAAFSFRKIRRAAPRERWFAGTEQYVPLGARAKKRILKKATELGRRTEEDKRRGKHYGAITPKFRDVLHALLYKFHNTWTGRCFPSYEAIAQWADCARSTVAEAIKTLEEVGLLKWVHRIKRREERCVDLFGGDGVTTRVVRTSNAYTLVDPDPGADDLVLQPVPERQKVSKSDLRFGGSGQCSFPLLKHSDAAPLAPDLAVERPKVGLAS